MIGLLLVGCSVSLAQPINMVFMLMDDVSLRSRADGGRGMEGEEEGGRRINKDREKGREKKGVGVGEENGGKDGSRESISLHVYPDDPSSSLPRWDGVTWVCLVSQPRRRQT